MFIFETYNFPILKCRTQLHQELMILKCSPDFTFVYVYFDDGMQKISRRYLVPFSLRPVATAVDAKGHLAPPIFLI